MTSHQDDSGNLGAAWVPSGHDQSAAIRRHLEEVFASRFFKNSHRYPNFLRYVVNETLEGRGNQLKERTIGIEIFGRKPDYDTYPDHIVRSTAAEVRKRLALFYQENDGKTDIRISLPLRSYVPVFHRTPNHSEAGRPAVPLPKSVWPIRRWAVYAVLAGIILFLAGAGVGYLMEPLAAVMGKNSHHSPQSLVDVLAPGPGQHLDAVIGDAALETLNAQIAGNFVSLSDYENHTLPVTDTRLASRSPASHLSLVQGVYTHEMLLISQIFRSLYPFHVDLRTPAEITTQDFQRDNMLLVEGPRANPWVQMFESRMNFRTVVRPGALVAEFRDMSPRPGEQEFYSDTPAQASQPGRFYGHIAYVPASPNHGKVLILNGPRGSYGALSVATDPTALKGLLNSLGVHTLNQLPQFEVLLQFTGNNMGTDPEFKIVAYRLGSGMLARPH